MILLNFRSLYRAQYVQFHTASKRSKWRISNDDVKQRPGQVVESIWVDPARREKNGRFFVAEVFPVELILPGRRSLLWRLGHSSISIQTKNKKPELLWGCCSQAFAMEMPWNSDAASSQAGSQVAFQETQCCFLKLGEWIPSSSRHYLTSRHVAPQSSVGSLVPLLYTWSCLPVSPWSLRADWHVKTDGYIVNHLARHASVRQHVVSMGERFRWQKFTVRIQLFPKTMGDWLSGISGWKYPNQYESWIGYASIIGWLIPIQWFLHLASGFTRPRGLMPPVKDPGHHLCCVWLSHVTC